MKKLLFYFLLLLIAACSQKVTKNEREALCDSINSSWPVIIDNIKLTKVSCNKESYTVHLTFLNNGRSQIVALKQNHSNYLSNQEEILEYGTYGDPYNKFIRGLREESEVLDKTIQLFSERLWIEQGEESNQGMLPLYVIIEGNDTSESITLRYCTDWL